MKSFLEKLENIEISFGYSILMFSFAIFLRTFLENFTNSNNLGMINGFIDTFFHYPIWFLAIFTGLLGVVSFFSERPVPKVLKVLSFGSFIIILPPIIDIIFYQHKIRYDFIVGDWTEIAKQYFSLFITTGSLGVGIKIEVILVLIGIFYYVYLQKKNIIRSLLAVWLSYTIIFTMLILPDLIYFLSSLFSTSPKLSLQAIQNYFFPINLDNQINLSRAYLSDVIYGNIRFGMAQNLFSLILSQISLYIGLLFVLFSTVLHFGFNKTVAIFKNFRWLRIGHYFFLLILGIILGQKYIDSSLSFSNIYDWLSLLSSFLALMFAWLFAVWENDEVDLGIDTLSNSNRPLVEKIFTSEEWKNIKWTFFILSILFSILSSYSSLILILIFTIIYHIYSAKPLRLKKYPVVSSMLIAINACAAFLLGFMMVSGDEPFNILPGRVLLGIFIFYMCVENIKNLKDIKGDVKDGILTIPVIFGEYKGKIITWFIVFLGTFAVPFLIFPGNRIFLIAPVLGLFSFYFIVRENYEEKPLMLYYLISFSLIFISKLVQFFINN